MKQPLLRFWLLNSSVLFYLLYSNATTAQIVPDATLPVNSNVTQQGNTSIIEGGTTAGTNLFHSFKEFSVPNGAEAFFNNALNIQNIFSRVTGGNISNIDGLIRANGVANLFLINPNGIIFGPNARLNIGGSFLASTASSIRFADGIEFSATNPNAPPLLTINVPIGLQYGKNAGNIQVQGKGQEFGLDGATESFESELNPLEVLPGKSLAIAGGNIIIDGGILQAPGGRVELGAVAGEGTIAINADGSLSFPDGVARADVAIANKAGINVLAAGGGSIAIAARNIDISTDSLLSAGIATGTGTSESMAGDISLGATEAITIDSSRIENNVNPDAIGNSGSINITGGALSLTNNARLNASTFGQGKAGNVTIIARDIVSFDGGRALSSVASTAKGDGGEIYIETGSLSAKNGAGLFARTRNQGDAGSITIKASDRVSLDNSLIASTVEEKAVGNAGDINIQAESLLVTNNTQIQTFVRGNDSDSQLSGRGTAGDVNIIVRDQVSIDNSAVLSGLGPGVVGQDGDVGKGGSIKIKAESLSLSNGAVLEAMIRPKAVGQGSNINIETNSLSVTNAGIFVSVEGTGKAGNITINARDSINFNGGSAESLVAKEAKGNGGNINITTGSLDLTNRAELRVNTAGKGDAGDITINARDSINFNGGSAESLVAKEAKGNGGNINITTGSLNLTNRAELFVNTKGQGNAGSMNLKAQQFFMSSNAALIGDVDLTGEGRGGDIYLNVQGTILLVGGETAPTGESTRITLGVLPGGIGKGGNLIVDAGSFVLKDGAIVKISSQGNGDAGNITINADLVDISGSVPSSGLPSGLFTSTNTSFKAGDITVNAGTFRIADGAALSARSKGDGQGGNIRVNATSFEAVNGGQLLTTTFGKGQAGNIFVNAKDQIIISGSDPNYNSRIAKFPNPISKYVANDITETASSGLFAGTETNSTGIGGGIEIATEQLIIRDAAQVAVNSKGKGKAGNINATASSILLDRGRLSANTQGGQGNIELRSRSLILRRDSSITTNAQGENIIGGNIIINADVLAALENSDITANSRDDRGGNVRINASAIFGTQFRDAQTSESDITAKGKSSELSGTVQINTPDVDPSSGLIELPANTVDPTRLIVQGCPANRGNSFTVTGRGGLPPSPNELLRPNNTVSVDWVTRDSQSRAAEEQVSAAAGEIIEATGWIINEKGQVVLIASRPTTTPNGFLSTPSSCPETVESR